MSHEGDREHPDLVSKLRRRLWFERAVLLLLVGILVGLYFGVLPGGARVCLIAVDGESVAVVETRVEARAILDEIKTASGLPLEKVGFVQEVTLHDVPAVRHPVQSSLEAAQALAGKLDLTVRAAAILADGEVIVALPDPTEAVAALSLLVEQFSPPDSRARSYLKEEVKIETIEVPPDRLYESAEQAVRSIVKDASSRGVHTVKSGESAWQIGQVYGVSLRRLSHANPGMDLEHIRVGDRLNIPGSVPPVTILARLDVEETTAQGRIRKVRITYENGIEVKREVIGRGMDPGPPPGNPWDAASPNVAPAALAPTEPAAAGSAPGGASSGVTSTAPVATASAATAADPSDASAAASPPRRRERRDIWRWRDEIPE